MIEWAMAGDALHVMDTDNAELTVVGSDLSVVGTGRELPRPVDETITVTTDELRFPNAVVYAFALGSSARYELDPGGRPLSLPTDEYVIDVDTEIKSYLRFSGRATIRKTDDFESIVVSFPEPVRVVVGLRSRHERPAGTITVSDSPADVASAISYLSSSYKTASPDRTYPTLRGHPPLIEFGDDLEIPDAIRSERRDSGIELVVPPCYESLYVTAPLAYHLQATVRTTNGADGVGTRPRLRVPEEGVETELSPMPGLERNVERLLRKTFFLDCLVRNAGPYGTQLAEAGLLDALEFDAERLYEATPATRLAAYLETPFDAIEHRLPEWHLATYVTPEYETAETLPFLLDRMSLLYTPRTSELEGQELIERSLTDFYRGGNGSPGGAHSGQVASVDIVKPDLRDARAHGWLADGVPIDVFKSTAAAYHNRLSYLERSSEATSICVVLNDPDMAGEHDDVAEIYRQRSNEVRMDVTVEEGLTRNELAAVFESDYDFVHYIGHCETDGLRCTDGMLSASSLDRSSAQTFFLNACGSYYEGMELIEKGSVAGAVTFRKVLNDHAIKVGSTFARLLVHGFSIERALRLARRRIMMGKDYAVVGDGTHSLTQSESRLPTTITLEELEDDRYLVTFDCYSTRATGSYYVPHTADSEYAYLCGNESSFTIERTELVSLLKSTGSSVIYDGDIYWSGELWSRFV
ncbi:hypothetical protein GWG54_14840 [Natronococcus sp. JC468]|uniref:hypothetical protein n=1 Tax=Natronococcus sp. JC468 TaxID=1961921 RepID=UPI00143B6E3A|nr:hypothetical protein [Natronococcus sp. JC468]NKE37075.1 hypothetical protein [Natronococcus sp. JC468]